VSDYETSQRKRDIIVGIFVVVALCAFAYLIFKFGDLPIVVSKARSFQIKVQFPSAPGLQRDTPVRFCGYPIGKVAEVKPPRIMKDIKTGLEYHQTETAININKKYVNIPADIDVKLITRGLGSSYIEISYEPNMVSAAGGNKKKFLSEGDRLQGSTGVSSEFFPADTQEKLDQLTEKINELVKNANDIIGCQENKDNLKLILANLSQASKGAVEALERFQQFADSGIIVGEQLSKTLAQLRLILEKVNAGEGTAARFLNDGRLYEGLLENTNQMESLLKELEVLVKKLKEKGVKVKL
jgi:ABC-type transporter Mla subunit MlaD